MISILLTHKKLAALKTYSWRVLHVICLNALQTRSDYVFLEIKLRGLVLNFHIHVSVSDLYIPTIGPPILLQKNRRTPIVGIY